MISFSVNGKKHSVDIEPDMPLLWVLRDILGMTGTKYGCGKSLCGACTVLLDGIPVRSCAVPIYSVGGKEVLTIEDDSKVLKRIRLAWEELNVPQCGYCQPGQIMSAVALLKSNRNPSFDDIDVAMGGNICRCGTYVRIRKAIKLASSLL